MKSKMHAGAIDEMYQRARELRNGATHAEELLWTFLKTKPFGYKFRRQHPYSVYILEFYCHKLKLVIEVDGPIHQLAKVKVNDEERQRLLEQDGLTVLRFTNEEITAGLDKVMEQLETYLKRLHERSAEK